MARAKAIPAVNPLLTSSDSDVSRCLSCFGRITRHSDKGLGQTGPIPVDNSPSPQKSPRWPDTAFREMTAASPRSADRFCPSNGHCGSYRARKYPFVSRLSCACSSRRKCLNLVEDQQNLWRRANRKSSKCVHDGELRKLTFSNLRPGVDPSSTLELLNVIGLGITSGLPTVEGTIQGTHLK